MWRCRMPPRVPLKTIQERVGPAATGSFTLDVYGEQPEWERNLEASRLLGAVEAVKKLQGENETGLNDGLSPIQAKGSGAAILQAF